MSRPARSLLEEALRLPEKDRADLAAELLASLGGTPDDDWDVAWLDELDRRARESHEHPESLVEWSVVRARILESLGRR